MTDVWEGSSFLRGSVAVSVNIFSVSSDIVISSWDVDSSNGIIVVISKSGSRLLIIVSVVLVSVAGIVVVEVGLEIVILAVVLSVTVVVVESVAMV